MKRLLIPAVLFALIIPNAISSAAIININLATSAFDARLDQDLEGLKKGYGIATMDIPFVRATALQDIRETKTGEVVIANGAQINLCQEESLPQVIQVSSEKGEILPSMDRMIRLVGALADTPTIGGHAFRVYMDPIQLMDNTPAGTIVKLTISKLTPAATFHDTAVTVNIQGSIY